MKVYIAHNLAAKHYLLDIVIPMIEAAGHWVTSSWVKGDQSQSTKESIAVKDLGDITDADTLIFFAHNFSARPGKGKYIELGFAIRAGKRCIVVDNEDDTCVFFHLPNIRVVKTIQEAIPLI